MNGIARISYRDGGVVLPAKTSYELEIMFEHLDTCTRRAGMVRLELDGREWRVAMSRTGNAQRFCTMCDRALDDMVYANASYGVLCGRCVRAQLPFAAARRHSQPKAA
jgi:hypothetical protein